MQAKSKNEQNDIKEKNTNIKQDNAIPEGRKLFLERQKRQQEYLKNLYKK